MSLRIDDLAPEFAVQTTDDKTIKPYLRTNKHP